MNSMSGVRVGCGTTASTASQHATRVLRELVRSAKVQCARFARVSGSRGMTWGGMDRMMSMQQKYLCAC